MQLTLGSIYSGGCDGFAYAATQLRIQVKYHIEFQKKYWPYLRNNYPESKIYRYDEYFKDYNLPWTHIIAGGDPCQPHSNSGNRAGKEDNRYRWPYYFRIVSDRKPHWIINENVVGTVSNMVLDQKIIDLESIGYTCQAFNIPACAVGADHERERIYLIANSNGIRFRQFPNFNFGNIISQSGKKFTLDSQGNPFLRFEKRICEPAVFNVPHGISNNTLQLEACGNAVVPQIPMIIMFAIQQMYDNNLIEII